VLRSIAQLVAALNIAAPGFQPKHEAAATLRELGSELRFDPLTLVAVVENESRWKTGAISDDGSFGLSQIRAINFRECREEPEGSHCEWRKQALLGWRFNLILAAEYFVAARERCRTVVGTGLAQYWLQSFQGFDRSRKATCGHVKRRGRWVALEVPALTKKILARRRELALLSEHYTVKL